MTTLPLLTAPPALRPGDAISIVAPASFPEAEACATAIQIFSAAGYEARVHRDFCSHCGYLAGTDEERADELNQAFADPETRMVLAVRGGYGTPRLLDRLDFLLLKNRPKIVCGYSDITALHSAIQRQCGLISFHGPNLVDGLGNDSAATATERKMFYSLATGATLPPMKAGKSLHGGVAQGRLVGGNLAVLTGLLGTPYAPDFAGSVLFLEETGEAPYRIDRMLTQLRLAGVFDKVTGIVCGYFTECVADDGSTVGEVLEEFLASLGVPVLVDFPAGHEHPNLPLPMGALVEIDGNKGTLGMAQSVVCV